MSIYVRFKDSLSYSDRFFVFTCSMKVASHDFSDFPRAMIHNKTQDLNFEVFLFDDTSILGVSKVKSSDKICPHKLTMTYKKNSTWTLNIIPLKRKFIFKNSKKPSFLGSILIFGGMQFKLTTNQQKKETNNKETCHPPFWRVYLIPIDPSTQIHFAKKPQSCAVFW